MVYKQNTQHETKNNTTAYLDWSLIPFHLFIILYSHPPHYLLYEYYAATVDKAASEFHVSCVTKNIIGPFWTFQFSDAFLSIASAMLLM